MTNGIQPVNLFSQFKKIFIFFFLFFVSSFTILNLIWFFDFASKQVTALAKTEIVFSSPSLAPAVAPPQITAAPEPEKQNFTPTEKNDSVEIPSINIEVPLVFAQSGQVKELTKDLERGVVVYPDSALPGGNGEITILGHSAPPFWPKIRYEWVFSKIGDLNPGDEILVNFEKRQYHYQVTKKIFLEKGQEIMSDSDRNSNQFLYLLTCWPPGRDLRRLAVEAMLVSPGGLERIVKVWLK